MNHFEFEVRYKVDDVKALIQTLASKDIVVNKTEHLIDQWFMPTHVKSQAEEHVWFDENRGIAWRIRRTEQGNKTFVVKVESKQLSEAKNHDTFIETVADVTDYAEALKMMTAQDYRCWLTIDKTRWTFASHQSDIETVLDEVAGLAAKIGVGAALELEYKGQLPREQALKKLEALGAQLGFTTADRFDKSLTVEAMRALADFGV